MTWNNMQTAEFQNKQGIIRCKSPIGVKWESELGFSEAWPKVNQAEVDPECSAEIVHLHH